MPSDEIDRILIEGQEGRESIKRKVEDAGGAASSRPLRPLRLM
jgi:hypothetical protein